MNDTQQRRIGSYLLPDGAIGPVLRHTENRIAARQPAEAYKDKRQGKTSTGRAKLLEIILGVARDARDPKVPVDFDLGGGEQFYFDHGLLKMAENDSLIEKLRNSSSGLVETVRLTPEGEAMAAKGSRGEDWTQREVEACVIAYLDMLTLEIAGQPYSKADFNRRVQAETGRSKGSVEFKMQNVSAVLDQMGRRWIKGYKPAKHAQIGPIKDTLERLLPGFDADSGSGDRPSPKPSVAAPPQRASLRPLTREAVVQAIEEFDDLGREVFLETYGYGEADGYWLLYKQGRYDRYDSKAIVGVAFKHIAGIERPLRRNEFSGGKATVQPALKRLKFDVEVDPNAVPHLRRPALLDPEAAEDQPFNPANQEDARDKVLREIRARRGQKKFREALVQAYEGRCAMTGCSVLDVLEAAHITPYLGPATNHVTNGLLLRADLHTLFDTLLLAVDAETMKVLVAPTIEEPAYRDLHGKPLRATVTKASAPSLEALKQHRAECRW